MSLSALQPLSSPVGRDLSFYPSTNARGELNIVQGTRAVASRLLILLLTAKGEDAIHPDLGVAPELFQPLSYEVPHYLVSHLREEILAWNEAVNLGLQSLSVDINAQNVYTNAIDIYISFIPIGSNNRTEVLSFGYWEWTGAIHNGDRDTFIRSLQLNGQPFSGLA